MTGTNEPKMNNLAETLKKHGLAASATDAINLANNVETNQQKVNNAHTEAFGNDLAIKESPTQGLEQNKGEKNMNPNDTLSKDQIVNVMQQFADQFSAEINKINSKIDNVQAEITNLKSEISAIKTKSDAPEPQAAQESSSDENSEQTLNELYSEDSASEATTTQEPEQSEPESRDAPQEQQQPVSQAEPVSEEPKTAESAPEPQQQEKKPHNPQDDMMGGVNPVSYTHLRAHET